MCHLSIVLISVKHKLVKIYKDNSSLNQIPLKVSISCRKFSINSVILPAAEEANTEFVHQGSNALKSRRSIRGASHSSLSCS